jgi:hypothetical protein
MVKAARASVMADRALIHQIVQETRSDARMNAVQLFGPRGHRTPASVCGGIARLLAKHMTTYDAAKLRQRTTPERMKAATRIVQSVGCGANRSLSIFHNPLLAATMTPVAIPDSVDDWLGENWHPATWSVAVQDYMNNGPGPVDPYTAGLTEFEVANLQAMECSQSIVVEDLGGGGDDGDDPEDPMMMYYWPAWAKAALIGCGSNMILNISEIATGVRAGAVLAGPWGGAAAGVAVAAEECLYGALAGYYVWKLTT